MFKQENFVSLAASMTIIPNKIANIEFWQCWLSTLVHFAHNLLVLCHCKATPHIVFPSLTPPVHSQIAKFMGPTWGPPGSCRPQMRPMLAPWTLLSGLLAHNISQHILQQNENINSPVTKIHLKKEWQLQNPFWMRHASTNEIWMQLFSTVRISLALVSM